MDTHFQKLWAQAQPYLQTRSNDRHTLYAYQFARQLVSIYPTANPDVVLPAILLHDVGWSTVPADKVLLSFGPNLRYPELRRQHEIEGACMAREILMRCRYDTALIDEITALIDGHDTRKEALSLNDAILRDADKLWAYTPFGMDVVSEWFDYSTLQYLDMLTQWLNTRFYTEAGGFMARGLLAALLASNEPQGSEHDKHNSTA
jgi:hypothetical protein